MYSESFEIPLSKKAFQELMDAAVDDRCLRYYEAYMDSPPLDIDNQTGEAVLRNPDIVEDALLELVFIADARAQIDNDAYSIVSNISWADVARKGIRRAAKQVDGMRGVERLAIFSGIDIQMQADAYDDMRASRKVAEGHALRKCTGLEYAARVTMGEIVLEDTSVIVQNH